MRISDWSSDVCSSDLRLCGLPVPAHADRAAELFRYQRRVFIAPPWREIFAADAERTQDFAEAHVTYEARVAVYAGLGYELVPIPLAPVSERVRFFRALTGKQLGRASCMERVCTYV